MAMTPGKPGVGAFPGERRKSRMAPREAKDKRNRVDDDHHQSNRE
ncbi:hypothetical protein HMPREF9278_0553 [Mobiluncus mulieris FB024-16]|nr:hypothetical protein [Mobiluncus mulieris]EFN94181.1 hypothetical protein HMPREF9278_0553 [Mobiluncus mulieris FB024-16]